MNHAGDIFKQQAKTFAFASLFLSNKKRQKIEQLYRFCRYVDDVADQGTSYEAAKKSLYDIKSAIVKNQPCLDETEPLIALIQEESLERRYVVDLLDGVLSYCKTHFFILDEQELITYFYRVAGTVLALMCPLLGVTNQEAKPYAIALGIAMQLTNIARDILEDAKLGRIYLPYEWTNIKIASQIVTNDIESVRIGCKRLLDLAELYYDAAKKGYPYLPFRSRFTILIAGGLYQAIGTKIRAKHYQYKEGRVHLSCFEKCVKSTVLLFNLVSTSFWFFKREVIKPELMRFDDKPF